MELLESSPRIRSVSLGRADLVMDLRESRMASSTCCRFSCSDSLSWPIRRVKSRSGRGWQARLARRVGHAGALADVLGALGWLTQI